MVDRYRLLVVGVILFISCDEQTEVLITNSDRIDFLVEILSDTTELKIIKSKDQLISNHASLIKPFFWTIDKDDNIEVYSGSVIKYISDSLRVNDTIFIKEQIKQNRYFDMDKLESYGFRIFDNKYYNEHPEIDWQTRNDMIDSLNIGKKSYRVLHISKPIFNKSFDLAFIRTRHGPSGQSLILEKKDQKWIKKNILSSYVE
ncbi:MAG: hypothetical protein PSN34_06595 [Urechidicola sp.]|nr:hypothetical protein [Urechidicola sp.]